MAVAVRRQCVVAVALSVAPRRSVAVAGVIWLDRPRWFIGCVVAEWCTIVAGLLGRSSRLLVAQQLFERDRGAGGFFEWGGSWY